MLPDLRLVLAALVTTLLFVGVSFSIFATLRSAQMQSVTGAAPPQRHPTVIDKPMATASLPGAPASLAEAREPIPSIAEYPGKVRTAPTHLLEMAARDTAPDLATPVRTTPPPAASASADTASAPLAGEIPPASAPQVTALQSKPEADAVKAPAQSATAATAEPDAPAAPTPLTNASAEGSGAAGEITGSTHASEASRSVRLSPTADLRKRAVRHGRTAQRNKRRLAKRVRRPPTTQAAAPTNPIAALFGGLTKGSRE